MPSLPPYSAHQDLELGNSALFVVEFQGGESSKLNTIKGTFPAVSVDVKGTEPQYASFEILDGVSVDVYKGSHPPTSISITFIDNSKDELYMMLNRWAGIGRLDGNTTPYKRIRSIAKLPSSSVKLIVTEFNPKGEVTQTNSYIVQAPKDALSKGLGKADAKSYSVDFTIIGIV